VLCADTSFLFSLYRRDIHSAEARRRLIETESPLILSPLNLLEFGNALRLAEFRGLMAGGDAKKRLKGFEADRAAGRWHLSEVSLADLVAEAIQISGANTVAGGHRAFDILHVAHAHLVTSTEFLSFDFNQFRPAKAVGLNC